MVVERAEQFLADFKAMYDHEVSYHPAEHYKLLQLTPGKKFAKRRADSVKKYIKSRESAEDDPRAYISEWATFLAIAKPLDEAGYGVEMAPQELEAGDGIRKGIDLIITKRGDTTSVPLLGVNVKLRTFKRNTNKETLRFDHKLCAPMISLSLGNWRAENRQPEPLDIRDWIDNHAVPKITSTGKLPHFYQFRQFVFGHVAKTLETYLWKAESHLGGFYETQKLENDKQDHERYLFPENAADMQAFYKKLFTAHAVFKELSETV